MGLFPFLIPAQKHPWASPQGFQSHTASGAKQQRRLIQGMGQSPETEVEKHLSPSSLDFEPTEVTDSSVFREAVWLGNQHACCGAMCLCVFL